MPDLATSLALVAVGIVGGIVSYVVSMASLVTYPALLALGVPPVAANMTNTVALAFTGAGSVLGARRELAGQRPVILRLAVVAAAGGATGAALLLVLPGRSFELVVPPLIAVASLAVLAQPSLRRRPRFQPRGITPATATAYYATAIYIGYFGAAGGILSLVALASIIDRPLGHVNAVRAVLGGAANGAALVGFALLGPVQWGMVPALAGGLFVGGYLGPSVARRLPETVFRALIAGCGLAIAAVLAIGTYGG